MDNPDTKKSKRSRQGGKEQRHDTSRDINKPDVSRDVPPGDQRHGEQRDENR